MTRCRVRASRVKSPLCARRRVHRGHPLADFNACWRIDLEGAPSTARAMMRAGRRRSRRPLTPWPESRSRSPSRSIGPHRRKRRAHARNARCTAGSCQRLLRRRVRRQRRLLPNHRLRCPPRSLGPLRRRPSRRRVAARRPRRQRHAPRPRRRANAEQRRHRRRDHRCRDHRRHRPRRGASGRRPTRPASPVTRIPTIRACRSG